MSSLSLTRTLSLRDSDEDDVVVIGANAISDDIGRKLSYRFSFGFEGT